MKFYLLAIILMFGSTVHAVLTHEELIKAALSGDEMALKIYRDASNTMTLIGAIRGGHVDIVKLLLVQGARPLGRIDFKDVDLRTNPLDVAIYAEPSANNSAILRMLYSADKRTPNTKIGNDYPLHIAIKGTNSFATQNLLAVGADPFLVDSEGRTSLELARTNFPQSLAYFTRYLPNLLPSKRPLPGSSLATDILAKSRLVLGLPDNFTDNEYKKAREKILKIWHPDRNANVDTTEIFKMLYQATENVKSTPSTQTSSSTSYTTEQPPQKKQYSSSTSYSYRPIYMRSIRSNLEEGKPFRYGSLSVGGFLNVNSLEGLELIPEKDTYTRLSFGRKLREVNSPYFRDFINLDALTLYQNEIASFQLFHPILKTLDLRYNSLITLKPGMFNLPSLTNLELSNNKISVIEEGAFAQTPNIEKIDLRYNQLTSAGIAKDAFANLPNLKEIDLRGNPVEVTKARFIKNHTLPDGVKLTYPSKTVKTSDAEPR